MSISLLQTLRQTPIAFVDVETSGASAGFGDRVIEVGIVRVEEGKTVAEYEQLIDPQRSISVGVSALTGISQKMVTGQPTFAAQFETMLPLLRGAVVIGHNIRFDLSFLASEFRRCQRDIVADLQSNHVLDTVRIARRLFGRGGNGLQSLCRRLGYVPDVAHRALPDAITTLRVFESMIENIGGWEMQLCDAIVHQGGPMGLVGQSERQSVLPLELEEALEQGLPVMMEYMDASLRRTQRVIKPLEVRRFKGELILVAHCELRNDRRNFKIERIVRLDRMQEVQPPQPVRISNNT